MSKNNIKQEIRELKEILTKSKQHFHNSFSRKAQLPILEDVGYNENYGVYNESEDD